MQIRCLGLHPLLEAPPLLDALPLLTALSICLEKLKQGQSPQQGQIFQNGANDVKVLCKNTASAMGICLEGPCQGQSPIRGGAPNMDRAPFREPRT